MTKREYVNFFFFSSRKRQSGCKVVAGVQEWSLPISNEFSWTKSIATLVFALMLIAGAEFGGGWGGERGKISLVAVPLKKNNNTQ